MKKTKFIGVVNGVEYNNVAEYNKAIAEAMKAGDVDAYTKTVTVDNEPEPETEQVDPGACADCGCRDCECEQCMCDEDVDFLPGFYDDTDKLTHDYVDSIVSRGDFDANFDNLCKTLDEKLEDIQNSLESFDEDDLEDYLDDITDIIAFIKNDAKKNREMRTKLANKLHELKKTVEACEQDMKVLDNADVVFDRYTEFYSGLYNDVESLLPEDDCEVSTTCSEITPQKELNCTGDELKQAVEKFFTVLLGK